MSPEFWRICRPFEFEHPDFRELLIVHLVELAIEDRSQVRSLDRDRMTILVPEGCGPRSGGSCGRLTNRRTRLSHCLRIKLAL